MISFYSEKQNLHATGKLAIEGRVSVYEDIPERAEILLHAVQEACLGPVQAPEDHGIGPVLAVHSQEFVRYLQTIYTRYSAYYRQPLPVIPGTFATRRTRHTSTNFFGQIGYYCFGTDSPILEGTWEAAYWSAQCALSAADRLLAGDRSAYALCRPPGHHAGTDLYGGFCYLNNAAIAARYLGARTAILDIDFHHGNGTQEIFYIDPTVHYCSLHVDPDEDYPFFWGGADERGEGPGEGTNRNWPLPLGTGEVDYLRALEEALEAIRRFDPRFLIVSAGFDTGLGDPLGGFLISQAGFREIGNRIASLGLPTLIVQEGGYLLEQLGDYGVAFLENFRA